MFVIPTNGTAFGTYGGVRYRIGAAAASNGSRTRTVAAAPTPRANVRCLDICYLDTCDGLVLLFVHRHIRPKKSAPRCPIRPQGRRRSGLRSDSGSRSALPVLGNVAPRWSGSPRSEERF